MEVPLFQQYNSEATSKTPSSLETLSIHGRARCHPGSRILVEPILWTKLQLELLRCTFRGPDPAPPVSMKLTYPGDARRQRMFERDFSDSFGNRIAGVRCLMGGSEGPLKFG